MSDGEADAPKAAVGYGKPPAEHRFKKGRSGNPKGRPRRNGVGTRDPDPEDRLSRLILQEAYRPIQVRENDKVETLPMIQAVIRSLGVQGAKGNHRAQLALTQLVADIERRKLDEGRALLQTLVDYKRSWQEAFEACDARGEPRPDPVPHPDEIEFNARTGEVYFNGPIDELEKAQWVKAREHLKQAEDDIAYYRECAAEEPEHAESYERLIEIERRTVDILSVAYPDEATRRVPGFDLEKWRVREKKLRELRAEWRKSSGR